MNSKTAIILAAGQGSRLKPFTDTKPKPLIEVNGRSILFNAIDILRKQQILKIIIVVGHLKDELIQQVNNTYPSFDIQYVHNDRYASTNSMYSLWMGLKCIPSETSVLVVEGDVFFEEKILKNVIKAAETSWVGDSSLQSHDGCYIKCLKNKVFEIKIFNHSDLKEQDSYKFLKSVGILNINKSDVDKITNLLKENIDKGNENLYYDLIFAENIENLNIGSIDISGHKWYEIDNFDDLRECEKIFS